jgi:hypothetical protein
VDVVIQDDEAVGDGVAGGEFVEGALGVADRLRGGVGVVLGVEVGGDDVVAEVGHVGFAGGVEGEVGWAHVGGEDAEDVGDGGFVLVHLVASGGGGEGVRGDLVTFIVGAADNFGPLGNFVDFAIAIVADDKESRFDVVFG